MPIQWNGTLQSPQQLASIIQGESSTPEGQFAVASVMYNRTQTTGFGGGITGVVTPSNFNGFNPNPSANAQSLANDLWNGNAPSGGSTGNALYFAAPSTSNAAWANPNTASGASLFSNGTNLGGNYYSDQMGPPSSNFQAPQYGSGNSVYGNADNSVEYADGTTAEDYNITAPDQSTDAFNDPATASSGVTSSAAAQDYNISPTDMSNTDVQGAYQINDNAFSNPSSSSFNTSQYSINPDGAATQAPDDYAISGSAVASPTSGVAYNYGEDDALTTATPQTASSTSGGAVAVVPGPPFSSPQGAADTTAQDAAIAAAAKTGAQQAQSDTQATNQTNLGIVGSIEYTFQNLLIRFGIIILGIVLIGAALVFLYPKVQEALPLPEAPRA